MNELQQFKAMLSRVGIGHGLRYDHNPPGQAVMVEHPDGRSETAFTVTEWAFDSDGLLTGVSMYEGEQG